MSMFSRLPACLVLLLGLALSTGCISNDKHLFTSLPHQPVTVTVIETQTQTELWKYDIPVWHKLMVNFDTEHQASKDLMGGPGPESMTWSLYGPDARDVFYDLMDREPIQRETVQLPGSIVAIKMTVRDPETEQIVTPVPGPAVAPAAGPGDVQQPGEATEEVQTLRAQPDIGNEMDGDLEGALDDME